MNKLDLMSMIAAATEITEAAQRHENSLRATAQRWDDLPDHSDYSVVGESFAPLAEALANWRGVMGALFPMPAEDPAKMAELVATVSGWGRDV